MRVFLGSFLGVIVGLVVFVMVVSGVVYVQMQDKSAIEDHSYLVIDLYGDMLEYNPPAGILGAIAGGEPETLQRVLSNLEKVRKDDRIDGVIVQMSSNWGGGGAMIEEIRDAFGRVRESGKKVYGFADSMDRGTCFLAAGCDSIFCPRDAYISLMGFAAVSTHLKGTMDKLGIKPNFHKIKDYKSAAELIMRKDLSPEAKENYEWLLDVAWDSLMDALREDRGLGEAEVVQLMNHALFTSEEAKDAGLIDQVLYWNELEEMLKGEDDEELKVVGQSRYAEEKAEDLGLKGKKTIAVIHAQGMIGGRKNKVDPLLGIMMGHESVVGDLKAARDDEDVSAIVFRVDSGGGDALTSDLIGHEVKVTSGVKPIVVSMVDVAASGGYHISYRASKIVADRLTLTGSIGSISGKFNIDGFHDKLGITHDSIIRGPNALMWSSYRDFTDEERHRFEENHWDGFNTWLADVADHRGMTFEEAEKLAHGRVWMGSQAKENGLIDEVGGLDRAIEIAKELADIPKDEQVTVVHYPEKKGLFDLILGGETDLAAAVRWVVYRFIREDIAETWHMLTERPMDRMEDVELW